MVASVGAQAIPLPSPDRLTQFPRSPPVMDRGSSLAVRSLGPTSLRAKSSTEAAAGQCRSGCSRPRRSALLGPALVVPRGIP